MEVTREMVVEQMEAYQVQKEDALAQAQALDGAIQACNNWLVWVDADPDEEDDSHHERVLPQMPVDPDEEDNHEEPQPKVKRTKAAAEPKSEE